MRNGLGEKLIHLVVGTTLVAVSAVSAAEPAARAVVAAATAPQPPALRLRDAMEAAGRHASTAEARLQLARSQAKFLETQNKTRVELRPSLGLLSFSNPLLLAANLGSGLMVGKRGAPSPATLQSAWFDVLTAELTAQRARTQAQAQAAHAFYALLEKQESAAQAAQLYAARREHSKGLVKMLQAARITQLDKLTAETQLLADENMAFEAESGRRTAAMELAMLMGRPEIAGTLRVEDDPAAVPAAAVTPASTESLFARALDHRGDVQALRTRIDGLRAKQPGRFPKPQSAQVGYGYVAGVPGGVSRSAENFLLGGHSARVDLGFGIALRDIGEKEAQAELMEARAKLLEAEMEALERQVLADVFAARSVIEASQHRVRTAQRKLELARQAEAMITARVEGGLGDMNAQMAARQAFHQAQGEVVQAECQRKAGILVLMVMCGLEDQPAAARLQALTQ